MTKGKRTTRYNLRKRIKALTRSSKKKSRKTVETTDCPCPPGYFDSQTGICHCDCHRHDNTEPIHELSGSPRQNSSASPSILQQEYLRQLNHETASQAGQPSPSTSFLPATQAGQPSPSTSCLPATQAGQSSPSTSFLPATQAGQPSPSTALHAVYTPEESSSRSTTPDLDEENSNSENESEQDEDETTPLLPSSSRKKTVSIPPEIETEKAHTDKGHIASISSGSPINSSQESLNDLTMDSDDMTDLQRQMVNLQHQMCRQLEAAQASLQIPTVAESTVAKPTPFHGRENENVDRWLQRFALYLANRKIHPDSDQAAVQLALHLSGPAESFYYNLSNTVQASYDALKEALKERFSPAHRHLRLRQALSTRRQGPNESIENFLADLNEKFSCLDLRDEDKLSYLIQGLRADIQADVLKKEPKTYAAAEDTARLIYSIQQSLQQRREEDISRLVQNAKPATSSDNTRMDKLEKNIEKLMSRLEQKPQDLQTSPQNPMESKIAAFQPMLTQPSEAEQLANLQQQMHQLQHIIFGTQAIAAYQPTPRENVNRDTTNNSEIQRLREEIRQLKTAQRDFQPQRERTADNYDRNRASPDTTSELSRALEEIRRMQVPHGWIYAYLCIPKIHL
ncbi:uncharacterized protein LOC144656625 [Oculina patagonica]